jgi:hypothetical protein
MKSDPLNLSGQWIGSYSYPHTDAPNRFSAVLIEVAGAIAGETSEHSTLPASDSIEFPALIDGMREGQSVSFRKYYDDPRMAEDVVYYTGSFAADGNEILGRWQIPGDWSGDFIMIRSTPQGAVVEDRLAEPVL